MPARNWNHYLVRTGIAAVLVLLVGWFSGYLLPVTGAALALYLLWSVINIWHLYRWLEHPERPAPGSFGLWAAIFDRISVLQKQNQRQRNRYQAMIEEFQSVTNAFPDATLVIDQSDVITWFNDAARRLLELRIPDDLGQPVTNLIRGPDFANWLAVADNVSSHLEMPSPLDDNVHLNMNLVQYGRDQRLLIMRDVTELRMLEMVRHDFVANVSHELRTPLTVLLGYLESIRDEKHDKEISKALKRMHKQARQMNALLNDLLELSRLQDTERNEEAREVDVPAMLMQLQEQAEEISQGLHEFRFDLEPDCMLVGAPADLESAFRNLITNAIHYTPDGGVVSVTWSCSGDDLVFSVTDSGVGIPKRDIPRLTERFYRVGADRSRHTGGTGLGLSIVKHVLNAHQANLVIESTLGEGSIFRCEFPRERLVLRDQNHSQ